MKKYGEIYIIKNLITGKYYVGQTTQSLEKRFHSHCNEKRNRHISNSIQQYGKENFTIASICSVFDKDSLNFLESFFVKTLNTMYPNGYNHRSGGNQNGLCSEELKKKISLSKKGKPLLKRRGEERSKEQRLKISRSLGGQQIIAKNLITNEIKFFNTIHETKEDGHNPSNVVQICKKTGRRKSSKNWTFSYQTDYANQSGSPESKKSEHAQRLGIDPTKKVE